MRILVIRFSALGDVAMTVPVLQNVLKNHLDTQITVLSKEQFRPIFSALDVEFFGADFSKKYKGFFGLKKLHSHLSKKGKFDKIIDLHGVLRSHILDSFFRLSGTPVYKIDKGRKEKKQLTRSRNKILKPLKNSTVRYAEVFEKAGLKLDFDPTAPFQVSYQNEYAQKTWNKLKQPKMNVGIAPFAAWQGKQWPLEKTDELVGKLLDEGIGIFFFGAPSEREKIERFREERIFMFNMAGRLTLDGEIWMMSQLDAMVAMDSGNMHLAALAGIPVVSLWGSTSPLAGFWPVGQPEDFRIEIPKGENENYPATIYGKNVSSEMNKRIEKIEVETVFEKVIEIVSK